MLKHIPPILLVYLFINGLNTFECDMSNLCSHGSLLQPEESLDVTNPRFITSSGNKIFVSSVQNKIYIFKKDLNFEEESKFGSSGSGDGQFNQPEGLSVYNGQELFVSDDRRIQVFKIDGTFLRKFQVIPPSSSSKLFGNTIHDGTLYIAGYHEVKLFHLNGTLKEEIDNDFKYLQDVAFTNNNELIVTQREQGKVFVLVNGKTTHVFQPGPVTANSVTIDGSGNILVSDIAMNEKRILIYDNKFNFLCNWNLPYSPWGIHVLQNTCKLIVANFNGHKVNVYANPTINHTSARPTITTKIPYAETTEETTSASLTITTTKTSKPNEKEPSASPTITTTKTSKLNEKQPSGMAVLDIVMTTIGTIAGVISVIVAIIAISYERRKKKTPDSTE